MIGAGAVVTNDILPYAFAIGVPARVHSLRFSEEAAEALVRLQWWNYNEELIAKLPLNDIPSLLPMPQDRFESGRYALNPPHHQLWS